MQTQTFVFFGQVGSGKGTQVKLLADYLKSKSTQNVVIGGTGDLFRSIIRSGNFTASLIKEMTIKGELLPDFLTNSLFSSFLISNLDEEAHLIADGYPRTVGQSTNLEKTMEFFKRKDIKIIYIELSEAEATKRNLLRGRADDTEEGLRRRFNEYKNNVIPAMDYFKNKEGYEIYTINGEQSVEDVHKEIINKLGMN